MNVMNEHKKGVFLKSNLLCPRCDHHSMAQYTDGFFCFHINCNEIIPEEEVDINNLISNNNKGAKKVRFCSMCETTKAKRFEWANVTGDYSNVYDYIRLCKSCHNRFDNVIINIIGERL